MADVKNYSPPKSMLWKALKPCSAVFTRVCVCVCFSIWGCRTLQVLANQLSLLVLLFPGMLDGKTSDHIFSTTAVLKVPLFISSLCSKPVFYMLRFYWSVDAWVGLLQVIYNYRTDLTHTSNPKKKKDIKSQSLGPQAVLCVQLQVRSKSWSGLNKH